MSLGAAYVFLVSDDGLVCSEQQTLVASNAAPGSYFGRSVAIYGNTIVVGAHGDDRHGMNAGIIIVICLQIILS